MTLSGLWFLHSDEPLMIQWLIDACRPIWQANHQVMKRIDLYLPQKLARGYPRTYITIAV